MATNYTIFLYSPTGDLLDVYQTFSRLEIARKANDYGALDLELLPDVDHSKVKIDGRILVQRQVEGFDGYTEGETVYFVRKITRSNKNNEKALRITAIDANHLLDRRIIAYAAKSAQASKTGTIDNVMKAIVRENLGSSAITARDLSAYIAVQADVSAGPAITKAFAYRGVLETLKELADASIQLGTMVYFDIVWTGSMFEFRTYTNRRGGDKSSTSGNSIIFSEEAGNLVNPELIDDYTEEASFVYAGGIGEGAGRVIATQYSTTRIGSSPFGRIEKMVDSRQTDVAAEVQADADAELQASRPRKLLSASLQDTPSTIYGVHYSFGDIVSAYYDGTVFDCNVDTVHITFENGQETLDIAARGELYV